MACDNRGTAGLKFYSIEYTEEKYYFLSERCLTPCDKIFDSLNFILIYKSVRTKNLNSLSSTKSTLILTVKRSRLVGVKKKRAWGWHDERAEYMSVFPANVRKM